MKSQRSAANLWLRVIALSIDIFLLFIVNVIIGIFFYDFFVSLGNYSRIVGFLTFVLYFGFLNSKLGKGQTIGKKIVSIKVVDANNNFLPFQLSILRISIFSIPFLLNGLYNTWSLPLYSLSSLLVWQIVFTGAASIIYLYFFNKKTRQSLHDLVVNSFVVDKDSNTKIKQTNLWRGHYFAIVIIFIMGVITFFVSVYYGSDKFEALSGMSDVKSYLLQSDNYHFVEVNVGSKIIDEERISYSIVKVLVKEETLINDKIYNKIALQVFESKTSLLKRDYLVVGVSYGFNTGIYQDIRYSTKENTIEEWKKELDTTN